MRVSRKSIVVLTALLLVGALLVASLPSWRWHLSPAAIQSHLLAETPLGSSEEQVLGYLQAKGFKPAPMWRGTVAANTTYPPNAIPGNSFTHAVVGEYGLIFTTSVEAFYVFGQDRRLAEIAVRKTTDAL